MEVIPVTNHYTQILSRMHLSHYSGLVVVLDVLNGLWQGARHCTTTMHAQTTSYMEPIYGV